jgi:hypothetical protein
VQRTAPRPWLGSDEIWTGNGLGDGIMLVYMLNVDSKFVLFVDFAMAVALGRLACMLFCFLLDIFRPAVHKGLLVGSSSSSLTSWHLALALCYGGGTWAFGVRFC